MNENDSNALHNPTSAYVSRAGKRVIIGHLRIIEKTGLNLSQFSTVQVLLFADDIVVLYVQGRKKI